MINYNELMNGYHELKKSKYTFNNHFETICTKIHKSFKDILSLMDISNFDCYPNLEYNTITKRHYVLITTSINIDNFEVKKRRGNDKSIQHIMLCHNVILDENLCYDYINTHIIKNSKYDDIDFGHYTDESTYKSISDELIEILKTSFQEHSKLHQKCLTYQNNLDENLYHLYLNDIDSFKKDDTSDYVFRLIKKEKHYNADLEIKAFDVKFLNVGNGKILITNLDTNDRNSMWNTTNSTNDDIIEILKICSSVKTVNNYMYIVDFRQFLLALFDTTDYMLKFNL